MGHGPEGPSELHAIGAIYERVTPEGDHEVGLLWVKHSDALQAEHVFGCL